MIPRIVHQIWLGETAAEPPPAFAAAAASWRAAHPGWEHRVWSGAEIDALFARARPDLVRLYRSYPYWVQRADAARYLVLHEHGGVYADLDIVSARPLDGLLGSGLVLAPTRPYGFSNDLMMARPRHPLMRALLDELPRSFRAWHRPWIPRHFRVMCGTGSLHLTRVLGRFPDRDAVRLLTADEYGHGDPDAALIRHIPGNSWAGWDTRVLAFLAELWTARRPPRPRGSR